MILGKLAIHAIFYYQRHSVLAVAWPIGTIHNFLWFLTPNSPLSATVSGPIVKLDRSEIGIYTSDTYATYIKHEMFKNKDEILFVVKTVHKILTAASWRRSWYPQDIINFMSFCTLFLDDIKIIWDENIVYFFNWERKLFWTNRTFVYLFSSTNYCDIIPK